MRFHHAFALALAIQISPNGATGAFRAMSLVRRGGRHSRHVFGKSPLTAGQWGNHISKPIVQLWEQKSQTQSEIALPKELTFSQVDQSLTSSVIKATSSVIKDTCDEVAQSKTFNLLWEHFETDRDFFKTQFVKHWFRDEYHKLKYKYSTGAANLPGHIENGKELFQEIRKLDSGKLISAIVDSDIDLGLPAYFKNYINGQFVTGLFSPAEWSRAYFIQRPSFSRGKWLNETQVSKHYATNLLKNAGIPDKKTEGRTVTFADSVQTGQKILYRLCVLVVAGFVTGGQKIGAEITGLAGLKKKLEEGINEKFQPGLKKIEGIFWHVVKSVLATTENPTTMEEKKENDDKTQILDKCISIFSILKDVPLLEENSDDSPDWENQFPDKKLAKEAFEEFEKISADEHFATAVTIMNTTLEWIGEEFHKVACTQTATKITQDMSTNLGQQAPLFAAATATPWIVQVLKDALMNDFEPCDSKEETYEGLKLNDFDRRRRLASRPGYGQSMERLVKEEHRCTCAM